MKKDIPPHQAIPHRALTRACSLWAPIDLTTYAPKIDHQVVSGSQKDSTDTPQEISTVCETGDSTGKVK